jgi:CheY-like chemotaxis protein
MGPAANRGNRAGLPRPALFVIDNDPGVVSALTEDLGRRFGQDFTILSETTADAGLAALERLAAHGVPVALLIADHDLDGLPGADFLARAHAMHPQARRVLLVERDYSVRSPVVRAMTLGEADHHLCKPWMLEQDLYRGVSEFLADWARDQDAAFELFHVIGGPAVSRWVLGRAPLALETSVPGIFAAGDARYRSIKRVASAVGDGATAVRLSHEYLSAITHAARAIS